VGGDPTWQTINAIPEDVTIKLRRVLVAGTWCLMASHTIRCGPINHLEPGYYVQLWNMFANRKIRPIDSNQRLTGLPSGSTSDLSATDSADNSAPAHPTISVQDIVGPDTTNPATGGSQILIQPNAPTGQIPVLQQPAGGGSTRTTGIIAPAYSGSGNPSATTLPANTYYRQFDRYIDMSTPAAPIEWLCITAGTNATSVWAGLGGGLGCDNEGNVT
jgi:hypothetical protein